jgi:hypothetical protein
VGESFVKIVFISHPVIWNSNREDLNRKGRIKDSGFRLGRSETKKGNNAPSPSRK